VSGQPAKIVLATHGRFHSFDLAEQLQRAGLLSAIYTPYPKFKLRNTRVDPWLIRSFPFVSALHRLVEGRPAPRIVKQTLQLYACMAIDAYVKATRPPCDILMALSGAGLASGGDVQRQGGRYVCDRGSTHLRYQMRLLAEEYDRAGIAFEPVHPRMIAREEAEYAQADAITVPSHFAARSFIESGVDPAKLHVVPYGVDLGHFQPTVHRDRDFRVLFVGQLSVRKGIGCLLKAFRQAKLPDARLVFVGSPTGETKALLGSDLLDDVEFTGALSREQVAAQMSRASVMVLPSVEEGLAMVQAQALACGCPVIATVNSGAEDIFEDGKEGFIVPARDADAIAQALTLLYRDRDLLHAMSQAGRQRMEQIGGWDRYGAQIIALFESLLGDKTSGDARV
jgi:glycosyltransferase involved in cell wall biosynthesis